MQDSGRHIDEVVSCACIDIISDRYTELSFPYQEELFHRRVSMFRDSFSLRKGSHSYLGDI